MKNLLVIAVSLCMAFNHLAANNAPKIPSLYLAVSEKSIVLNLTGLIADAEFLKIIDERGTIIFSDEIENNKQRIKYNLGQLPNNDYVIKLESESVIEYYHITISNDIISLQDTETFIRPSIRSIDQKVFVNSPSTNEEYITLNIYNEIGAKVYSFNEIKSGEYHKAFNLENLYSGTYRVIVSTEHFDHEVEVSL